MRLPLLAALLLAQFAIAQTPPTPTPPVSTLPSILVGGGTSWTRGQAYPYSAVTHIAIHVGTGSFYSWSEISTPIATVPKGSPPLASALTTGMAWVAAQSPGGRMSLVFILNAGVSTAQATITPAFSGSFAVPIRIRKSNVYVVPYFKASNAAAGGVNGAVATFTMQPGLSILYGFEKRN
jgi:hypothetical protein